MTPIIHSRRASYVPGDSLRELTRDAIDSSGRIWRTGQKFRGLSSGMDNIAGCDYVRVTMLPGGDATFHKGQSNPDDRRWRSFSEQA